VGEGGQDFRREGRLTALRILSGGAAQGAACALATLNGFELQGDFGAVGTMQQKLLDGEACDVIILTRALVEDLEKSGRVLARSDLGVVRTAIAVRAADRAPDISSAQALRAALSAADEIYFPDPEKATAGIHFMGVLRKLGVQHNLKTYPNGATAMREMTRSQARSVIGCTQATEILNIMGTRLVGPLPREFELATVYTAAVCAGAAHLEVARRFVALLGGDESRELRRKAGFEL
jgi:molybdate transport system substrate-binding protein